jgi:hypothetical protein
VESKPLQSTEALKTELETETTGRNIQLRLYVVEDLSRDVIELLGYHLGIEPDFFREHIVDYAWYNIRDRWRDPSNLNVVSRKQNWIQIRYVTARYFDKPEDFQACVNEASRFNVLRRPDDDESNKAWWDKKGAIIGLTRSRASFWIKNTKTPGQEAVGTYGYVEWQ